MRPVINPALQRSDLLLLQSVTLRWHHLFRFGGQSYWPTHISPVASVDKPENVPGRYPTKRSDTRTEQLYVRMGHSGSHREHLQSRTENPGSALENSDGHMGNLDSLIRNTGS